MNKKIWGFENFIAEFSMKILFHKFQLEAIEKSSQVLGLFDIKPEENY
jgi:hypothetical protein